jgi:hypothetical protein
VKVLAMLMAIQIMGQEMEVERALSVVHLFSILELDLAQSLTLWSLSVYAQMEMPSYCSELLGMVREFP